MMRRRTSYEEEIDSGDGEGSAIEESEVKKEAVFKFEDIPLNYI